MIAKLLNTADCWDIEINEAIMNLTVEEIIRATDANVFGNVDVSLTLDISTDSRNVKKGQIYLPLKGEKFDGHDFISNALENGANGYFTQNEPLQDKGFALQVEDTKEAYLKIARFYKRKINPITIAITGSSGKTTTKEMMFHIASEKFKTHKSILNHNNEVGLCQTLTSMEPDVQVLIVEMGMRGPGEIELLSEFAEPDIAILTNVGPAHIGRLGSLSNIAAAKLEITKYLHREGTFTAHDDKIIKKFNNFEGKTLYFGLNDKNLKIVELKPTGSSFEYKNQLYKVNLEGEHNIQNALGAIEAGLKLGMSSETIAKGLEKFKPIEKRWEIEEINGLKIINDSYNANPDSVKAALKTFLNLYETPKIIVLGDMGELGDDEKKYHAEIGGFLNNYEYDCLITVGELARSIKPRNKTKSKHFESNEGAAQYIAKNVKKGSNILLKASRSMKFEEIIEELKKI